MSPAAMAAFLPPAITSTTRPSSVPVSWAARGTVTSTDSSRSPSRFSRPSRSRRLSASAAACASAKCFRAAWRASARTIPRFAASALAFCSAKSRLSASFDFRFVMIARPSPLRCFHKRRRISGAKCHFRCWLDVRPIGGLPSIHFSANLAGIMRKDLDHLPAKKQRELARVVEILFAEFEEAQALVTSAKKKSGRILKIVLLGSYARGGWVDEPHTAKGYLSDYDLLIVVNHRGLKDVATYSYKAEDRIIRDPAIKTPVNFIVHTLSEVNDALAKGQYFFSDIRREGIALYELPGQKLMEPKPLTPEEAYEVAKGHYERWFPRIDEALLGAAFYVQDGNLKDAAFTLHQATERAYDCVLLVLTNYAPATHNIKFLRSLAERLDERLIDVWPRETKFDRRCFELLKRAYVEARYSEHYKITAEELEWLGVRVQRLQKLVGTVCQERLMSLSAAPSGEG